jgi:hypothetical protein
MHFKERNGFAVWLVLPLITLGIYHFVWYYKINRELRDNGSDVEPGMALLALTLGAVLIVPPFVSVYNTGQRIAEAQRRAGVQADCSGGIGVLLMFLLGLYPWYYQAKCNQLVR